MIRTLRCACLLLGAAAAAGCSSPGRGGGTGIPGLFNGTATATISPSSSAATVDLVVFVTAGSPHAYADGVTVTDLTHGGEPEYVPVTRNEGTPFAELHVRPGTYRLTADVSGEVTCPPMQVDVAAVSQDQESLVCSGS